MAAPLRVLIADDSPTARALLAAILGSQPAMELVGQAQDGLELIGMAGELRPSIILIDIHMPHLGGLAATRRIMAETPTPILIVSSTANVQDEAVLFEALRSGALGVCRKPGSPALPDYDAECRKLIEMVSLMADIKVVRRHAAAEPVREPLGRSLLPRVVAVACSTGGPAALYALCSQLPCDFALPILVVQHMAAEFLPGLARWLGAASPLRVKLAEAGEPLSPATVYLAPAAHHLGVTSAHTILLAEEAPIGGFRPAGTFLFQSVARTFGRRVVALILSGMGEDGVAGLRAVRAAGGFVVAQDQASSAVFGMPGAAIAAGLADAVVPSAGLAAFVKRLGSGLKGEPPCPAS